MNVLCAKTNEQGLNQNASKFPRNFTAKTGQKLIALVSEKTLPLQIEKKFYEGITEDKKEIRDQWTIPPAKLYAQAIRQVIEASEEEKRRETQLKAQERGNKSKSHQKKATSNAHKKKIQIEVEYKNENHPSKKKDFTKF